MLTPGGETTETEVSEPGPVILFEGVGLASTSAAAVGAQTDEEFDYAFANASREVQRALCHLLKT